MPTAWRRRPAAILTGASWQSSAPMRWVALKASRCRPSPATGRTSSASTNPATRPRTPEDFRLDPDSAAARFRPAGRSRARAPADARPVRLRRHRGRVCPGQANPQPSAAQTALKEAQSIAGPKRLFGTQGLVEFAKTLAKCIAVLVVCIWVLRPHVSAFVSSSACTPLISCAPPGPCRC